MNQAKLFIQSEIVPLKDYPGCKATSGAWQKILSEIPECDLFIDAMCGSGFIGSVVTGCKVFLNDIDRQVIDKIRYTAGGNVELGNQSYEKVIMRFNNASKRRVFYFDPPYLMETRSYQGRLYRHEWTAEDHRQFLKVVQAIKSPVMISHYPCDLYDRSLKKWRKITYTAATRGGPKQESLYLNYAQPVLLQCPGLVGANFTDRQRIQRKVSRMVNKLKNEPGNERAAILSTIIAHFNYVISGK